MKGHCAVKIIRVLLGIMLAVLVVGLGTLLVSVVGPRFSLVRSGLLSGGAAIQVAMLVISLIFILALSRGRPGPYGFRTATRAQMKAAFVFGSIAAVMVHIVVALVWRLFPPSGGHPALVGSSFVKIVITVWIIASNSEEVVHRGLVQSFLEPLRVYGLHIFGIRLSLPVIVAALLFGSMHIMLLTLGADGRLVGGIVGMGVLLGLVAGYYREKSGSLIPAILVHTLFNIYGSASEYIQNLVTG
jgi:membrane protease YdiL (CAAX protease family)